jgi:toxin ParE1/3/4
MSFTIEKSVQATRDIEEAFVFIAEGNLDIAVRFLVAVEESLEMMAEHPMIGSSYRFEHEKLADLRIWRVKGFENYLMVYLPQIEFENIRVMRILNSSRDLNAIFGQQ